MSSHKGGNFERLICKQLSRWWTGGERDDIFWRCSQSGGRATQRMKSGCRTFGSYGDIAAIDPIGLPLLQVFTIELKRGRSHGVADELIDSRPTNKANKFEKSLLQAMRAHKDAGSLGWMLICRRDYKIPVAYMDLRTLRLLRGDTFLTEPPCIKFGVLLTYKGKKRPLHFVAIPFEILLQRLDPAQVIKISRRVT